MRRDALAALTVLGLPLCIVPASALEPSPEGTAATIAIRMTVRDQSRSDFASATIERILNAECLMRAGPASQIGRDGPTGEQEAAANQAAVNAEAFGQQYGPSEDMMAEMEAAAEQCGDDEACIMALVMKMSQSAEIQAMAENMPEAQAAMQNLQPDLGPVRYQIWQAESCVGTVTVNDTYVDSDPGGEGGDGAYTDTTVANGSAPIMEGWAGLMMEVDLLAETASYVVAKPVPVRIPAASSMRGAIDLDVPFLASADLPERFAPQPGLPGHHQAEVKGATGSLLAEWWLKQ